MSRGGRRLALNMPALRDSALTLSVAGLGGGLFYAVGFPAPALTGAAAAVTAASLAGLPTRIPTALRDICFLVVGIGIGATVTPEAVRAAAIWPVSLVALAAMLIVAIWLNRAALMRWLGYDRNTAFLASVPGHMSYVIALSQDYPADEARVGLISAFRVLVMTLAVPLILGLTVAHDGAAVLPGPMPLWPGLSTIFLSAALGALFLRLRLPAALLLGGMAVSGLGHATGIVEGGMPIWSVLVAFLVLGALIGTRFRGRSVVELQAILVAALAVTVCVLVLAALFAWAMSLVLGLSPALLFVAFAPGGLEAMAAMAVQLDLDPPFVAAHHVMRLLFLTLIVPLFLARRPPN